MNQKSEINLPALIEWDRVPLSGKMDVSAYEAYKSVIRRLELLEKEGLIELSYANPKERFDMHFISIKWLEVACDFYDFGRTKMNLLADLFAKMDSFAMPDINSTEWFFTVRLYFYEDEYVGKESKNGFLFI